MATTTDPQEKTLGNVPCPGCGCPYPGDHTQDCQLARDAAILAALKAIQGTIRNLTDGVSGLNKIVQHQQGRITALESTFKRINEGVSEAMK